MSLPNGFCRIYQSCFAPINRIVNNRVPRVVHHRGALLDIPEILAERQIRKPMIVTDTIIGKLELVVTLCDKLEGNYYLYDEVKPDPPISVIERMVALYKENGCDGMIAIGGGSNIDSAKAMGARIARPNKSLSQLGGALKVGKEIPFFIAVPTTAGTGSECTVAAVVTDDATHHKYAVNDPVLCPDVAVLDPLMTVSLPKHLTAFTGMDALTHAVEAYLNKTYHRANTKTMALEAISAVIENLPLAYEDGTNVQAREEMLVAAHKAGIVFSNACVGNVHAIAHATGGKYHVQHGLANAIVLPYVLKEFAAKDPSAIAEIAKAVGVAEASCDDVRAAAMFIEKVEAMNESFSIPKHIDAIQDSDIAEMAAWADREANPLYPVPVIFDKNKFAELFEKIKG